MLFANKSIKRILAERGYSHCRDDDEFTRHGDYARNLQYVYSKEFKSPRERVVDLIFISVDIVAEVMVITLFRENVSIENGVLEHADTTVPLGKFSYEEFEKKLDKLIPRGNPLRKREDCGEPF